jgi:hypothetical protein
MSVDSLRDGLMAKRVKFIGCETLYSRCNPTLLRLQTFGALSPFFRTKALECQNYMRQLFEPTENVPLRFFWSGKPLICEPQRGKLSMSFNP